jgi:RNA recognition motif-containing protein
MTSKLYVGNLSYQTNEEGLRAFFEENGRKVTSIAMPIDRETGSPRGFAFVELDSPEAAQAAIQDLNGRDLDGRALRINEAREREPRRGGGGGGRGGFGGGGGGYGGGGFGGGGGGYGGGGGGYGGGGGRGGRGGGRGRRGDRGG